MAQVTFVTRAVAAAASDGSFLRSRLESYRAMLAELG